ncbi:MAG: hypothetical protein V5A76_07580 [Candidatus Thermoplasmatota archaeon]
MCGECCETERGKHHGHHRGPKRKGQHGHGKRGHHCNFGCNCSCGDQKGGWRKFKSKEEKREELEEYKKELEHELQAVKEKLEEI